MEGKVTVFFCEDGQPMHVLPMDPTYLEDSCFFACGDPLPDWWAPHARHQCLPAKVVGKIVCEDCRRHVREALKEGKKPAKKMK